MPTSLTMDSRFRNISLGKRGDEGQILAVCCIGYNGYSSDGLTHLEGNNINLDFVDTVTQDHQDSMAVLNQIYQSPGGFRNLDGDPIPASEIWDRSGGETRFRRLWFNPFDYDAYKSWIESQGSEAIHVRSAWEEDAGTGFLKQTTKYNIEPGKSIPDAVMYEYGLDSWGAASSGPVRLLVLGINSAEGITAVGLDNYLPALAMLTWLRAHEKNTNGIHTTGTNADDVNSFRYTNDGGITYTQIEYEYTHSRGRQDFQVTGVGRTGSDPVVELLYSVHDLVGSPITLTSIEWNELLNTETATLDVVIDSVLVAHSVGAELVPVKGNALESANESLVLRNGEIDHKIGSQHYTLGPTFGAIVRSTNLAMSGSGQFLLPKGMHDDTIHFSGLTADMELRVESPSNLISNDDRHRTYSLHNTDSTYAVSIRGFNNGETINLQPEEDTAFRVVRTPTGGELLFIEGRIPSRKFRIALTSEKNIGDLLRMSDSGLNYRLFQTEDYTGIEDVFEFGKSNFTASAGLNINVVPSNADGVIKFNRPGKVEMFTHLGIYIHYSATGSIERWHALDTFHRRGTTMTKVVEVDGNAMEPEDVDDGLNAGNLLSVVKDDLMYSFWKDHSSRTIANDKFRFLTHYLQGEFIPIIHEVYTA